jgi:Pyruvate/2-oxoacid:ferredoxin oxidoreductase delta subunit
MTNEVVKFNSRCILCARCWTFCPENAISIPFGPKRSYIGIDEGYRPPKVESV